MKSSPLFNSPTYRERGDQLIELFQGLEVPEPDILLPTIADATKDILLTPEYIEALSQERQADIGKRVLYGLRDQTLADTAYPAEVDSRHTALEEFLSNFMNHPVAVESDGMSIVYRGLLAQYYPKAIHGFITGNYSERALIVNKRPSPTVTYRRYDVRVIDYRNVPQVKIAIGDKPD